MSDYNDLMTLLDRDDAGDISLYLLDNGIIDGTVFVIYGEDTPHEQCYCLVDWQGPHPETIAEIPDYDWVRVEDIDYLQSLIRAR